MVKQLVYAIFLFGLLPTFVTAAPQADPQATPQVLLIIDKTEIQLGHHIVAELYGINLQEKLINIDLRELEKKFGMIIEETTEETEDPRWPDQPVQLIQLKLYPRQVGKLTIPILGLAGIHSKSQPILVKSGINKSRTGDTNIRRDIKISSTQSWERQQVVIEMTVTTTDTFVSLRSEEPKIPGFEVFILSESTEKIQRNGTEYSVLRIGWALFPLSEGQYNIDIPPIEYRKSGRALRTYFLPQQNLNVKALPPYIPPTMPVGKINIASSLKSGGLIFPDTLSYWDIELTGHGVSPNWMPPVLRQINSNADIRFFPTNTQHKKTATKGTLQSQVLHHIPFKPVVSGRLNLPALRVQYFDPDSGRIMTTTHQLQSTVVLGMTWRLIIGILLCLFLLWTGKSLYEKFCFIQLRQNAVDLIEKASTIVDIRKAITILARAEGWPANMTLRNWTRHWRSHFNVNDDFDVLMKQLSKASYSKDHLIDLDRFRAKLLTQIRSI
jgi:hypothetical protein